MLVEAITHNTTVKANVLAKHSVPVLRPQSELRTLDGTPRTSVARFVKGMPQTEKAKVGAPQEVKGQGRCTYLVPWDGPHGLHDSQGHQMLDKWNPLSQL